MVMPASCDGAATRVTVLSSQPLPLTHVTQTPVGNMRHARLDHIQLARDRPVSQVRPVARTTGSQLAISSSLWHDLARVASMTSGGNMPHGIRSVV